MIMQKDPENLRSAILDQDDQQPTTQPFPISLAFQESINKLRELYIALARKDCKITNQFSISRLGDEYGRLGVWGRNARADRKGRGSLDDIVRKDPDLRSVILEALNDLSGDLDFGMYLWSASSSGS